MVEIKDYESTQGLEELEGWRYFPIRVANRIKSFWANNSVLSYLRRHRLKRTLIISYALLGTMVWTATTAYFSPTRVTYLESQLQATQSFGNGLGSITATSMTYSSSNGLVVMELTTSDATSAIKKGINTENLDWQVFLPSSVKNPEAVTLEVIPLTGDKVYLAVSYTHLGLKRFKVDNLIGLNKMEYGILSVTPFFSIILLLHLSLIHICRQL